MKRWFMILPVLLLSLLAGCSQDKKEEETKGAELPQPYWNIFNQSVAKAENGYYYWTFDILPDKRDNIKLYYMNQEGGERTAVCNKPDCTHTTADCNAVFRQDEGYDTENIYFYKGYLYVLKKNKGDGLTYLEQITSDGSTRKTLFEVGAASLTYHLVFHEDSVYINDRYGGVGIEEAIQTIRRRSLNGEEDEELVRHKGRGIQIAAVKIYEDKLYYTVTEWPLSKDVQEGVGVMKDLVKGQGLYTYDLKTKEAELLINKEISDYTVDPATGKLFYFVTNDGIYRQGTTGESAEKIYACEDGVNNISQISTDGKYLYVSNERFAMMVPDPETRSYGPTYLWVLNMDGAELNRIKTPGVWTACFSDGQYVFSRNVTYSDLLFIPVSEIETAKEWKNTGQ